MIIKYDSANVSYEKTYAVITDAQGSIMALYDTQGKIVWETSYDAWGRERSIAGVSYAMAVARPVWLIRGYTGHEHLAELGLINMNGRMYDPQVGRMLSPDNFVQDATSTQGYNRYTYVLNNPLKYKDPSGEWVQIILGAAIGGVINLVTNWNNIDNFWEGLAVFGAGAGSGALTAAFGPLGALAGGALTGATNNVIAQTGNGVAINQVNWGQVGVNSLVGSAAGIAGYGAGQWASNHIGNIAINGLRVESPVLTGAIKGMVGGAAGGSAGGFTAGFLLNGGSVDAGLQGAWSGLKSGAVIGGALGAGGGYLDAKSRGINPWTGKPNQPITPNDLRGINQNTIIEKNGRQFEIQLRTQGTSGDGATSYHIIEIIEGNKVSITHMVVSPNGVIIHQHQYFIGESGNRYYNPNMGEFPTINLKLRKD